MKQVVRSSGRWWGAIGVVMLAAGIACAGASTEAASTQNVEPAAQASPTEAPAQQTEASAAGPASPVDACAVLTQADAEGIFGGASGPGVTEDTSGLKYTCTYTSQADGKTLELMAWTFDTPVMATGQLSDTISSSYNSQTVNGVGDHAVFDYLEYARFSATKGSYFISLILRPGDASSQAALTTLATTILGRLP